MYFFFFLVVTMSTPNIRITSNGDVVMKLTKAAEEAKRKYRSRPISLPLPPIKANEDVQRDARDALQREGVQQPDEVTLLGWYKIQRGQYYGHTFKWLSENDAGYAFYLWREHLKGPSPGKTDIEVVRATDNLSALVRYMSSFEICNRIHQAIIAGKAAEVKAKQTGDPGFNILGFGKYHNHTYKDMLHLLKKSINDTAGGFWQRRVCIKILQCTGFNSTFVAVPYQTQRTQQSPPHHLPHLDHHQLCPAVLPSLQHQPMRVSWQKMASPAQEKWMWMELKKLGLLPGTVEYMQQSRWLGQPLWRTPPPGELQIRKPHELPTPDSFWIHPMFVWCPEVTFKHLLGSNGLPCITPDCNGQAEKRGLGRPRVVVGTGGGSTGMPNTGQYYILTSTLHCKKCKCSPWAADQPAYLKMLPQSMQNLFPAVMTYRKAVCKSLVDQLRRSGRSPGDMAKEIQELLQLRYEREHNQYLHFLKTAREQSLSGRNLDRAAGLDPSATSIPFGHHQDLQNLKKARTAVGAKGDPSKKEIRKHCRTVIPDPSQLETRVEAVISAFQAVEDSNGIPLFKDNMINEWKLQRTHIRRGCLSDPRIYGDDEAGEVLYRLVDYINFRGRESAATRLPAWQPLRGTSKLEGFYPHQARWVTISPWVSPALFQAQAFLGLARWNWSRGTEHRKLKLPAFDPRLTAELNQAHVDEYAELKYPDFCCNSMETGEQFGIDYSQEVVSVTSMDETDVHIQYSGDSCTYDETEMDNFEVDIATQQELEQMLASPREEIVRSESPVFNPVAETGTTTALPTAVTTSPSITSDMSPGQSQGSYINHMPGSSSIPNQQSCGHPSSTPSSSSTSQPVLSLRKNTLTGMVTNWHPDKWTPAMVTVINKLLAEHSGKNRMDRVVTEYRKLVYAGSSDDSSQLRMTNKHFIQLYERELNRRMEGQASINYSVEQTARAGDFTSHLDEIITVPPPDDPYHKKRPVDDGSSSSSDEEPQRSLVTEVAQAVIAQLELNTKKSKKTKRRKILKGLVLTQMTSPCLCRFLDSALLVAYLNQKYRVLGIYTTHTSIRDILPFSTAFFYSLIYGTPETMTFDEFWVPAVEAVQAEKQANQAKKAAAAKMREEKGWKKPGGPSRKK
ncbi:hypothetical protein HOLleu_03056 [Holothuria leucospilota]|uniref:DUF6729 domain-containing protein n=1 Tax=Holothuria leucospilota TaxID=206669 RepID=A0A9Q1CS34_HOLLE|nr:hypothetical protein HOLleu_03056 [Holothuria leucospilota]